MDRKLLRRRLAGSGIISYHEKDLLGGWVIEVRKGLVHVGNIRRHPFNGEFQYYPGSNNQGDSISSLFYGKNKVV